MLNAKNMNFLLVMHYLMSYLNGKLFLKSIQCKKNHLCKESIPGFQGDTLKSIKYNKI